MSAMEFVPASDRVQQYKPFGRWFGNIPNQREQLSASQFAIKIEIGAWLMTVQLPKLRLQACLTSRFLIYGLVSLHRGKQSQQKTEVKAV
jgi:hypothetical protein